MVVRSIIGPNGEVIEGLEDRIQGRFVAEDVKDKSGNVLVPMNGFVSDVLAKEIVAAGIEEVAIRSVFTSFVTGSRTTTCLRLSLSSTATTPETSQSVAPGSTNLLPGETVDMFTVEEENRQAIEQGGTPALQKRVLLGPDTLKMS